MLRSVPEAEFREEERLVQELSFRSIMLWTIIVILLVLWVLGLITSFGGGLIHLLLVLAVILVLVRLISGRRPVV